MSSPDFSSFRPTSFSSVKTGKAYTLERIGDLPATAEAVENIVAICNEPGIYDVLFRKRCAGTPYTTDSALSFLQWAAKGWAEKAYFVFAVLDGQGNQIGAVDIKSANLDGAEVGYWASARHQGVMTPAVGVLCQLAKRAGYRALTALTDVSNLRSQKVLLNNGFAQQPEMVLRNERHLLIFRKML